MKKNILKITFFLTFFLTFTLSFQEFSEAQTASQPNIVNESLLVKAIDIEGNNTISDPKILSQIKTKVGQTYIESVISADLKRLYNTGYFTDVRVDREPYNNGYKVVFMVKEKIVVEEVTFSETKHIKQKKIQEAIETKEGKFLDKRIIKEDIKTIKALYSAKGWSNAEVEAETFIDDLTQKGSVHFIIREGQKIEVDDILISGHTAFKTKKILKVMKTKKDGWFSSGLLKEDVLEQDMERIEAFYEQEGYIDAIADYEVEYLQAGNVLVKVGIVEGDQYRIGQLSISGNNVYPMDQIKEKLEYIGQGEIYSRQKLNQDMANIRTLYFDDGYIFAKVLDKTSIIPETGEVDIDLDIIEGNIAHVGKINVKGNTRTRDIVIRRELRLFPGDKFDGAKLKRSRERLNNLGYFEEVNFNIDDTSVTDTKDLTVEVKEAKTGSFSFGGGFSSVDRLVGFIELEQRNFDIKNWPNFTGGGQRFALRAEGGSNRSNFRLSFTEPWINDYPISGGFDLYLTERQRDDDIGYAYDEKRIGGVVRLGKEFTEYFSGGVSYRLEQVDISDFELGVSADLLAEEGENTLSVLGFNFAYDRRDNKINPTDGWLVSTSLDVAGGPLAGDKDFFRTQLRGNYYIPFKWDSVLEFRARAGTVEAYGDSDKVPIFERFFAGGSRSIRGYEERGVGPLDSGTRDPIGGEAILTGSIEYTIPVVDFLKFAVFYDVGNVWADVGDFGDDLVSGFGAGLRIKTPIGPISLDYGVPVDDVPEDDGDGKFYFSVTRGF